MVYARPMETSTEPTTAETPETFKGEMCVLNHEGDTKLYWNASNDKEVEMAKETFDSYIKKGFSAFRMEKVQKPKPVGFAANIKAKLTEAVAGPAPETEAQGARISEFDPKAGTIIFVPQLVGG